MTKSSAGRAGAKRRQHIAAATKPVGGDESPPHRSRVTSRRRLPHGRRLFVIRIASGRLLDQSISISITPHTNFPAGAIKRVPNLTILFSGHGIEVRKIMIRRLSIFRKADNSRS